MVHLVVIRNPFDLHKKDEILTAYKAGQPVSFYFAEPGEWHYSINGELVETTAIVPDECYLVIMPVVEKKALGLVLTIGLSVLTSGIAGGTIFAHIGNAFWRSVIAMAIGVIGGIVISKMTAVKPDKTNASEQANTYGWGGAKTLTGQGFPLAITYGRMKSGGILLSRHVISDGEKQYLNLLYCAGEGELTAIDNIKINENPISNYNDVEVDIRLGENTQEIIPNFNDNYADQPLNYELTQNWSTHQVQGNNCEAIELTVSFPNGLYYSNDGGGMSRTKVTLEAQYRKVGTEDWQPLPLANDVEQSQKSLKGFLFLGGVYWTQSINGGAPIQPAEYTGEIEKKTNKAWHKVYRFDNLEPAQYEVRMRCAYKEGASIRYANKVYWSQLTQIIYDDFIHPGKALIGIKALATDQLSGSDPQVTWEQERRDVYVWNPYIGGYEAKPANNPAWACYDIIHQCRKIDDQYVVRGEKASRLIYDKFKAWADECAAKGYTFNYIYDAAGKLWDQLRFPEAVGRGKILMQGTRFTCVHDYAAMPTQLFTVGNIKKDSFKEDFQGLQGRANAVEIAFLNRAKNYERDVLPVYSDDYDSAESLANPAQVELMGCVELEQAFKHGKHYLRANRYEIRTITFEALQDAIACTIGDVVLVQHDMTDWGAGGRVQAVAGLNITLDREVDISDGEYRLLVRNSQTDEVQTHTIISHTGATVTVDSASGIYPDALYALGKVGKEAKPFRVLAISKGMNDTTRKITCMEYYPELYSDDYGDIPVINYSSGAGLLDVVNLRLTKAEKTLKGGTVLCDIAASWSMPRGRAAKRIHVYYKRIDAPEFTLHKVLDGSATSAVIPNVSTTENYTVKILCINDMGVAGAGVIEDIYIVGKELPPPDVTGFKIKKDMRNSSILHLSWNPANASDIAGYRLYNGDGQELVKLISGTTYVYFIPNSGTYDFLISAIDTSGNLSVNATLASVTITVTEGSVVRPKAPANGHITLLKEKVVVSWEAVTNTYVEHYEVIASPSWTPTSFVYAKTADIKSEVVLPNRTGTIYIVARNPVKGYGPALPVDYNFPAPEAPTLQLTQTITGFTARTTGTPPNCKEIVLYITGTDNETLVIKTQNTQYSHNCQAGIYTVQAAFADMFGVGALSDGKEIAVRPTIDPAYLTEMQVTEEQLDQALKDKLINFEEADGNLSQTITNITTELNKAPAESGYQSIHSLVNALAEMSSTIAENKTAQDGINTTTATQIQQQAASITAIVQKNTGQDTEISQIKQTASGLQSIVQSVQQTTSALDAYSRAAMEMAHGKLLINDPCFKDSVPVYSYDNSGSEHTSLTPVALVAGDPQTGGRKVLVKHNWDGESFPGDGGFGRPCNPGYHGRILIRFVAKLASDSRFVLYNNVFGAGGTRGFITSDLGTGKWEEYIAYWRYGDSGTISACGFVACEKLDNSKVTTAGTLLFELSSVEYYDVSQYQLVPDVVQSQITQNANSVTSIVANLSKAPGSTGYSALTQLHNAMQLKVEQSGVIAAINLSPNTVKIAGKYIQIDGNTQFTNNVIVNRMLAANAVTADKINVTSLSAICAKIGLLRTATSGARLEIESNQLRVYDTNNKLRVRMGVW